MRQLIAGIKVKIKNWDKAQELYFSEGKKEIAEQNLNTLIRVSCAVTVLVAVLIMISPFIIAGWRPTLQHLLLVPVSGVCCLSALHYQHVRKDRLSVTAVSVLCHLFINVLFLFVIAIDVFQYKDQMGSFMQVVLIGVPVLFVFPSIGFYTEIMAYEFLYATASCFYKEPGVAAGDCFNSIVGLLCSFLIAQLVQRLRREMFFAKNEFQKLSMTDSLTGILNKGNCEQTIIRHLERRTSGEKCALLVLDVDNFKAVNDTMGHQSGDLVLENVGTMLLQTFRGTDILGRFGGDEFMILMRNVPSEQAVEKKCEIVNQEMESLTKEFGHKLTCSIGIAFLDGRNASYEAMFRIADDALYEAKALGKERHAIHYVYDPVKIEKDKPLMLIADDGEVNRAILREIFKNEFEIVEADEGNSAVSQIGQYQERLSMVLLDLIMPEMNGYQILSYMKSRERIGNIPVVVITADARSEKDVLKLGAADIITKPFDAEVVQIRVRNALKKNDSGEI